MFITVHFLIFFGFQSALAGNTKTLHTVASQTCSNGVCKDGTISRDQPVSTGLLGWNGYCGDVAVSNVLEMRCHKQIEPISLENGSWDWTPGQKPVTLLRQLQSHCNELRWSIENRGAGAKFLGDVKTQVLQGPVLALLNSGGMNHHWITVIRFEKSEGDLQGCHAIYNSDGSQHEMTCEEFVSYGNHSGFGYTWIGVRN